MLSRETLIALRARHTAFRIALDILYPEQRPPEPPPIPARTVSPPPIPARPSPFAESRMVVDPEWLEYQLSVRERAERRWGTLAKVVPWLLIAGIIGGMVLAFVAIAYEPAINLSQPPNR